MLAENLLHLIDQARPIDWLAARISDSATTVPWTIRVHDIGDFFSVDYAKAWTQAVSLKSECSFWFYTRSFLDATVFDALTELASLPNCQGWLSLDAENYEAGILAKCKTSGVWKVACLQDEPEYFAPDLLSSLKENTTPGEVVSFPYHRSGRHVAPVKDQSLVVCPAVLGAYNLTPSKNVARPCQSCGFCLPA